MPGSPIKVLMPRRGAVNETYRNTPSTAPATPSTPSLSAPAGHRGAVINPKATPHANGQPQRPAQPKKSRAKSTGFMTRGARVEGMDPVRWISSVKVERDIDSGPSSMLGSRATSVERASGVDLVHGKSERSLSRSIETEVNEEGDAEDLADECVGTSIV